MIRIFSYHSDRKCHFYIRPNLNLAENLESLFDSDPPDDYDYNDNCCSTIDFQLQTKQFIILKKFFFIQIK